MTKGKIFTDRAGKDEIPRATGSSETIAHSGILGENKMPAEVKREPNDEKVYGLLDFWMTSDEMPDMGPCFSIGRPTEGQIRVTAYEILKSLDLGGQGELLTKAAELEVERYKEAGMNVPPANELRNLRVSLVRYHDDHDIIPFSWQEFCDLGRPRGLRERSVVRTEYTPLEQSYKNDASGGMRL